MLHLLFAFFALGHDTTPCSFSGPADPPNDDRKWTKVETEAYFIDGPEAWKKLVDSTLQSHKHSQGTYQIQFFVHTDGSIEGVLSMNGDDSRAARALIKLIKDHPCAWHPAIQNGRMVNAYHKETITYP